MEVYEFEKSNTFLDNCTINQLCEQILFTVAERKPKFGNATRNQIEGKRGHNRESSRHDS